MWCCFPAQSESSSTGNRASPEAPKAAVTSRRWVCACWLRHKEGLPRLPSLPLRTGPAEPCGSRRRCPSARGRPMSENLLLMPALGKPSSRCWARGRRSSMPWPPHRHPCSSGGCQHIPSRARPANTGTGWGGFPLPRRCSAPVPLMAPLTARVPAGLRARAQPDKVTSRRGIPVSSHLDHVVQRFVKQVYELAPNVEQVDLAPGNHDPGEGPLIRAGTLQRGA